MDQFNNSNVSTSMTNYSPLYGNMPMKGRKSVDVDVKILAEPEVHYALEDALGVFEEQLSAKNYSYLTINSYSSAVNRFIDFLREGEVIPDPDRKNKIDEQ